MVKKKKVYFRFYEELNDFLPKLKKNIKFTHLFTGNPSVKDVIESIGVPQAEIDLILVNGKSVNFSYIINDEEDISVYPVFELLDISNVTKLKNRPLRNTKFILDVHLGKLAKLLRLLGFDTYYRNNLDDKEIISISVKENRIILTRDIGILKNKNVSHGYWVRSQLPKQQIEEIIKKFDLSNKIKPFTRCTICNGKVVEVEKNQILHLLKPKTIKYFNNFYRCSKCNKIYWEGSHYLKMKKLAEYLILNNRTN